MKAGSRISNTQEQGGITILVALLLLVLLTVTAISMSKNALREAIISGTVREGTEVRNLADDGIEWSCYWLTPSASAAPDTAAQAFLTQVKTLSANNELSGTVLSVAAQGAMTSTDSDGITRKFNLDIIRMGKQQVDMLGGAPSTGAGGMTRAVPLEMLPDIWSIRSTGILDHGVASMAFQHAREAWITAPPQVQ